MITFPRKENRPRAIHKLKYLDSLERWHAYDGDTYFGPIHCGDSFYIQIENYYFQARMELDAQWYMLIGIDKFRLHTKQSYDVILLF